MFSTFRKGEVFKDHFEDGVYVCAKCGYELFSRFINKLRQIFQTKIFQCNKIFSQLAVASIYPDISPGLCQQVRGETRSTEGRDII